VKNIALSIIVLISITELHAQRKQSRQIQSPDESITTTIEWGNKLYWSVKLKDQQVILPSVIALHLKNGEVFGTDMKDASSRMEKVNSKFETINYKKDEVIDQYTQLTIKCKGGYGVIFRAYNDGVAYRFFTNRKDSLTIENEEVNFNFTADNTAYIPYANDPKEHDKYQTSFENYYQHINLSKFVPDTVAFVPLLVELAGGKKAVITEADLEEYPGMFLQGGKDNNLHGSFAKYVLGVRDNPGNVAQSLITSRADFIAKTSGTRNFPWRVMVISNNDKDLLNNDMVYKLASPSRIKDVSWIKPGKAAWDWWCDWNVSHVNFRAGPNTATYKYFIDFASTNHLEYFLMDASWADGRDLMKVTPGVNLPEILEYANQKKVGIWLWAGSLPMQNKMDEVLDAYSKMGVKGFKVDFMDRDDQKMVRFYYTLAKKAAAPHVLIDYHGAYKPTGLQHTFPNVLNIEGVRGMENEKWQAPDMPPYDATIPFIRMLAGPMDYTPGAMKNGTKSNYKPIYGEPMSAGTRCHQLAMYVVFEAPFEMLSDNPNNYEKEQESTSFIVSIPTTFNETVALESKVGEYAAIARRKGITWYVGALGNWNQQDILIDLSFLGKGNFKADIFRDGINADREATDYIHENIKVSSSDKLSVHLSNGGGWTARIYKE
jgi:alpha-glucosidase